MNFEFSDESMVLRDQARAFLRDKCGLSAVRGVFEGKEAYASALWREMAVMGWLGATIPEECGGSGLGYEMLCVLAEELGRVVAPVPFSSSIYLATEAILAAGTDTQKQKLLPAVADGSRIGTFALAEGLGRPAGNRIEVRAVDSVLEGENWPVPDGMIADFAIIAARDEYGIGLYHVDLLDPGLKREALSTFDPGRGQARFHLTGAQGERLGGPQDHESIVEQVLERAAILTAFEQVGGAEACLHMARDYALHRVVFGRSLASFQAIKHKLVDMYVDIEIARSNAYFGAWALSEDGSVLSLAAAAARVAAIDAFRVAAKENIQLHGGAGFTWELDCHFFYRRAKVLALMLGGAPFWMNRLVDRLDTPHATREDAVGL